MTSAIDTSGINPAWPQAGDFLSADGRANFEAVIEQFGVAATELSALQAITAGFTDATHLDGVVIGAHTAAAGTFTNVAVQGTTTGGLYVGRGTNAPAGNANIPIWVQAVGGGGNQQVYDGEGTVSAILRSYGLGALSSFAMRHARGTIAAPTAVQNTDALGTILFVGRSANGTDVTGAQIGAAVNGTVGNGIVQTDLVVTACDGSGALVESGRFNSAGFAAANRVTTPLISTLTGDLRTAPSSGRMTIENATSIAQLILSTNSKTWSVGNDGSIVGPNLFAIADETAGKIRFSIDTSGNVAIGGNFAAESLLIVPVTSADRSLVAKGSNGDRAELTASVGGLRIKSVGTADIMVGTGSGGDLVQIFDPGAVATSYLRMSGGAGGLGGQIGTSAGDMRLFPSTGIVQSYAASSDATLQAITGVGGTVDMRMIAQTSLSGIIGTLSNHPLYAFARNATQAQFAAIASTDAWPVIGGGNGSNGFITTNQRDLELGSASGLIKFASAGSFTANGAVATALTSLGPTGSHTTVQEWLTIKNASGTTRYIPCF